MMPARNSYLASLGYPDPGEYRQPLPGDPPLPEFLPIGAIVRTPYRARAEVTAIYPYPAQGVDGRPLACWTVEINNPGCRREASRGWYNEMLVHGGRILHLFLANEDEITVEGIPAPLPPPPPPWADLPLFATPAR